MVMKNFFVISTLLSGIATYAMVSDYSKYMKLNPQDRAVADAHIQLIRKSYPHLSPITANDNSEGEIHAFCRPKEAGGKANMLVKSNDGAIKWLYICKKDDTFAIQDFSDDAVVNTSWFYDEYMKLYTTHDQYVALPLDKDPVVTNS